MQYLSDQHKIKGDFTLITMLEVNLQRHQVGVPAGVLDGPTWGASSKFPDFRIVYGGKVIPCPVFCTHQLLQKFWVHTKCLSLFPKPKWGDGGSGCRSGPQALHGEWLRSALRPTVFSTSKRKKKEKNNNSPVLQRTSRKEKAELHLMAREEWMIYFSQEQEEWKDLCKLLTPCSIIKEHTLLCSS